MRASLEFGWLENPHQFMNQSEILSALSEFRASHLLYDHTRLVVSKLLQLNMIQNASLSICTSIKSSSISNFSLKVCNFQNRIVVLLQLPNSCRPLRRYCLCILFYLKAKVMHWSKKSHINTINCFTLNGNFIRLFSLQLPARLRVANHAAPSSPNPGHKATLWFFSKPKLRNPLLCLVRPFYSTDSP